jgi:hypothetical protein
MIVTNKVTVHRLVGQWSYDEPLIVVTDNDGREYVIQPAENGGLQIMTCDGETIVVAPRSTNTIEVRGAS